MRHAKVVVEMGGTSKAPWMQLRCEDQKHDVDVNGGGTQAEQTKIGCDAKRDANAEVATTGMS